MLGSWGRGDKARATGSQAVGAAAGITKRALAAADSSSTRKVIFLAFFFFFSFLLDMFHSVCSSSQGSFEQVILENCFTAQGCLMFL